MNIRETIEKWEQETLSPYASLSANTRGRERKEPLCDIRPEYQRDRDRILHSKSFRRLKQKTQVFLAPEGDHYRTRLTHTLEVSQIARTIAKALRLNESLAEAIALGHDLGHTPFGHSGEAVLNRLSRAIGHLEKVKRMVEEGYDCSEVLIQLAAVRSALDNTGKVILKDHLRHCMVDAVAAGDTEAIDDLCQAIDKFMK